MNEPQAFITKRASLGDNTNTGADCYAAKCPPSRNLSFTVAMEYLKKGMCVKRACSWGYLFLVQNAHLTYIKADGHVDGVTMGSVILASIPDNKFVAANLDSEDMLAEDWELLP